MNAGVRLLPALLVALFVASALRAASGEEVPDGGARTVPDETGEPYRTPMAGEGFRTHVFGRDVVIEPRDRRSVSAWDAGTVSIVPRVGKTNTYPFASLYFWRRPDEDTLLRAVSAVLYNDIYFARSPPALGPFEAVLTFNSLTPPAAQSESIDGEPIYREELYWGTVRPGVGLGWRRDLESPGHQDNMAAVSWITEPGLLYFDSGHDTAPEFIEPRDTFELRTRLQARCDALERNLLELPHRGWATGADLVYGYRAAWDDWGIDARESARAGRDYIFFTGYALAATRAPFLDDERHRVIGSVHGGIGDALDRFSGLRLGGGPTGEDYEAVSRAVLPGATLDEFRTDHYVVGVGEYRWEAIFFAYVSLRASVAYVDRERSKAGGVERESDVLGSLGCRVTSGFAFKTRIQVDYNYNAGVIRDGDYGGHEVVMHISRSF